LPVAGTESRGTLVDTVIVLAIVGGIALWLYDAAYHSGKREGSRKAYGVGYSRGRKAGSSGCLIFFALLAIAATAAAGMSITQ
jgi:hypothetical protein